MKRLLLLFSALFLFLASSAYDFEVDGIYYNKLSSNTVEVTCGNTRYTKKKVTIPESVTYIGSSYSVNSIGNSAFQNSSGLTSIVIPESVTSIGNYAFSGCQLSSITIPESVTAIGDWSFSYCCGLTSITIPNSVTSIGRSAFYDCNGLTSVTIGNSVTSIGGSTFYGCSRLTSITIPNSVTTIEDGAFYWCSGLTSITIPNSVISIGNDAFRECFRLSSFIIPNSVTSIGECAFFYCNGLTTVTIPESVNSIGYAAFQFCNGLKEVTCLVEDPSKIAMGGNVFDNVTILTCRLYVPKGSKALYEVADQWKEFGNIVELEPAPITTGLTYTLNFDNISYSVSGYTTDLPEDVFIPNEYNGFPVTRISSLCFSNCKTLNSVSIPASVTQIGDSAFSSCSNLTSITIPNSVTSIEEHAFSGCISLTSVTMPESLTTIGNNPFLGCELTAFYGKFASDDNRCLINDGKLISFASQGLSEYNIPNTVSSIGHEAFMGCKGLTSVKIPSTVTSIGSGAFQFCSSMTSVIIPESVTIIDTFAFGGCTSLTSITIPESVTSIGFYAFADCMNLISITIPNSVTSIDSSAFDNCRKLTEIICLVENPVKILLGSDIFSGVSISTCTLYVPKGSKALYEAADQWKEFGNIVELDPTIIADGLLYEYTDGTRTAWKVSGHTDDMAANVVIPAELQGLPVTEIGDEAFYICGVLTSISIPSSITSIGDWAFCLCSGLTEITIPNSVTSIGVSAFLDCDGLTSVTIPNSVTSIGESAFFDCNGLTSIAIPSSVTFIENFSFAYCQGLTSIAIPESVTSIGNSAFSNCSGLTSITIPNSVTEIGDWAFGGSCSLPSITIPNSVTSIGECAFSDCCGLKDVTCLIEDPSKITMSGYVFNKVPISTCTLFVPKGGKALYEAADQWKEFGNIVEIGNPNVDEGYELSVEDMVISPRKTTNVPVYLNNKEDVTSMQFDIHLPAGLTLAKDEYGDYAIDLSPRFDNTFTLTSSNLSNGGIRVLVYSSRNHSIQGNEGAIIELPVVLADQTATEGAEFIVRIDNISVTMTSDKTERFPEDATATLTLGKRFTPGDVNDDGRYSAADVSMIVSYVLESDPAGGIREAADINEDGRISAADVSLVVSYILEDRQIESARSQSPLRQSPLRPLKGELQPGGMSEISECSEYSESSDISVNADGSLDLSISGISAYSAAQFDIALPECVAVKNVSLRGSDGTGHSVAFSQSDGTARVLVFSPLNRNFSADATFEIELDGSARGNIDVDGIRLVEIAGSDITETSATGCAADFDISGLFAGLNRGIDIKATAGGVMITAPEECDITIADTLGRTLRHHLHPGTNRIALSNGVYFINNKKVIIK